MVTMVGYDGGLFCFSCFSGWLMLLTLFFFFTSFFSFVVGRLVL